MTTTIEGIYKKGIIKPIEYIKLKDNTKVVITVEDNAKKIMSLIDLAGVWKNRKDIDSRFREILKERENFSLEEAK